VTPDEFFKQVRDDAAAVERDQWEVKFNFALDYARRYGTIDGDHHKMWVIDQMVRSLLGSIGYAEWRKENPEWSEGIAP
jgi:hypothetical protein